ncbi:MAG: AraC family transcriptional regulator [Lachnospiraceae bacterium]|nr:AraC family transcriptional regulator [Lachnospiraceae bacterium]
MSFYGTCSYPDILFRYLRTESPVPDTFRMHTHDTCELYYFLSDHAIFHVEGNEYHLSYGDLMLMRPTEAHYIEIDPTQPYERATLNFNPSLFAFVDPENRLMRPFFQREAGTCNHFRSTDFPDETWRFYLTQLLQPSDDKRLQILSALFPLLNELQKHEQICSPHSAPQTHTLTMQIIRHINQNLDQPLSLNSLCSRFYISQSQLCRIFKRSTGASIGEYITTKRLLKAQQMLRAKTPATKVLTECGFNDYSAFYRAYHKYFGVSPSYTMKETGES